MVRIPTKQFKLGAVVEGIRSKQRYTVTWVDKTGITIKSMDDGGHTSVPWRDTYRLYNVVTPTV